MSLRLVLVDDTHVPKRARALPGQVWAAVADADVVFHAGDRVSTPSWTSSNSAAGVWSAFTATTMATISGVVCQRPQV